MGKLELVHQGVVHVRDLGELAADDGENLVRVLERGDLCGDVACGTVADGIAVDRQAPADRRPLPALAVAKGDGARGGVHSV